MAVVLAVGLLNRVWGTLLLILTLVTAGLVLMLVLAPFLFETPPPGLTRAKPRIVALAAVTVVLLFLAYVVLR